MDFNKVLTVSIASAVVITIGCITSCGVVINQQDDAAKVRMVEHGADPIAAMCSINSGSQSPVCIIAAGKSADRTTGTPL